MEALRVGSLRCDAKHTCFEVLAEAVPALAAASPVGTEYASNPCPPRKTIMIRSQGSTLPKGLKAASKTCCYCRHQPSPKPARNACFRLTPPHRCFRARPCLSAAAEVVFSCRRRILVSWQKHVQPYANLDSDNFLLMMLQLPVCQLLRSMRSL